MITEIPTSAEFHAVGLNQLYLAWEIAMKAVRETDDYEQFISDASYEDDKAASWQKAQPALANAFALVQQAMEMALKGRIAKVSPYLLIARDPKDWPRAVEKSDVPFSEFRTVDAADLLKVHNTFSDLPLDDTFRDFWEKVRRDRNKIMHSVAPQAFDPATIVRNILTVAETLFSEISWAERLIDIKFDNTDWFLDDYSQNDAMWQIELAMRQLTPAECDRFFNFKPKQRAYQCPECRSKAETKNYDELPSLAQLLSKNKNETGLKCVFCNQHIKVERRNCNNSKCKGNVIFNNMCLTCLWKQDSPINFPSGLTNDTLGYEREYQFEYHQSERTAEEIAKFEDDSIAIEHARRAMSALYLSDWIEVTISKAVTQFRQHVFSDYLPPSVVGTWQRRPEGLVWLEGQNSEIQRD